MVYGWQPDVFVPLGSDPTSAGTFGDYVSTYFRSNLDDATQAPYAGDIAANSSGGGLSSDDTTTYTSADQDGFAAAVTGREVWIRTAGRQDFAVTVPAEATDMFGELIVVARNPGASDGLAILASAIDADGVAWFNTQLSTTVAQSGSFVRHTATFSSPSVGVWRDQLAAGNFRAYVNPDTILDGDGVTDVAYMALRLSWFIPEPELSPCYQTLTATYDLGEGDGSANAADDVVWRDGDPATYVTTGLGGIAYGLLDSYSGPTALDLTVSVTAASPTGDTFAVDLLRGYGTLPETLISATFTAPAGSTQVTYTHTFSPADYDDYGHSFADVIAGLGGTDAVIEVNGASAGLMVSEVSVRVGHKCYVSPPPLRRFPHLDGYGQGPRRYPNPPRLRPAGGGE